MLGKLTWDAVPFDQPIPLIAGLAAFAIVGLVVIYIILRGWAPYLWREWITSVDHKHIGVMYVFLAAVMLLRGFVDAIMMRSQQALAYHSQGYLPPDHYDQIFAAHGTLMIFFVAMAFLIGLINIVVPMQLGVRDVAFNSVSFWLTATGALWRSTMRELADARRWIARMSTLVGREDMVGELGVMSCHIVALDVANGAAVNPRRPCGRRNKGKCRGACR